MAHHCHAPCCSVPVPPEMLMCKKHWFSLPRSMRNRVWATYRKGQCEDWQITHEYACAARAAVRHVGEIEGRSEEEIANACRVYDMLDPVKVAAQPRSV